MQKTNLLAVYSIQTNMLSAIINQEKTDEVCVLLNNGKILRITCPTDRDASHIFNTLHFYPVFQSRSNNSIEKDFNFTLEII
jgi:hypothetical protein